MNLLITGSREASPELIEKCKNFIYPIAKNNLDIKIIVGDADGIDDTVIRLCEELKVPYESWGAFGKNKRKDIIKFGEAKSIEYGYVVRDDFMAKRCDKCLAFWNGTSKGTEHTIKFASHYGKKVTVIQ
jgi:hypothetical protein